MRCGTQVLARLSSRKQKEGRVGCPKFDSDTNQTASLALLRVESTWTTRSVPFCEPTGEPREQALWRREAAVLLTVPDAFAAGLGSRNPGPGPGGTSSGTVDEDVVDVTDEDEADEGLRGGSGGGGGDDATAAAAAAAVDEAEAAAVGETATLAVAVGEATVSLSADGDDGVVSAGDEHWVTSERLRAGSGGGTSQPRLSQPPPSAAPGRARPLTREPPAKYVDCGRVAGGERVIWFIIDDN